MVQISYILKRLFKRIVSKNFVMENLSQIINFWLHISVLSFLPFVFLPRILSVLIPASLSFQFSSNATAFTLGSELHQFTLGIEIGFSAFVHFWQINFNLQLCMSLFCLESSDYLEFKFLAWNSRSSKPTFYF